MSDKIVSPQFSLKGWSLKEWFLGNGKTIKELLKVGIPLAIGYATTSNPEIVGLITIAGKFLLDVTEYYLKEYKME